MKSTLHLLVIFLKVTIQWKWKGLSTVILSLVLQSNPGWSFYGSFWKSQFNENQKDFQLSFCLCFYNQAQIVPFINLFKVVNSMQMKRTFKRHFGCAFTLVSESRNLVKMKRTFNCHFVCSLWKLDAPAVSGRFCTELACPC